MNAPIPNRVVEVDPVQSRRVVNGFCAFADVPSRETFTSDEVVELLKGVGYAVTLNTLGEFVRKGYIGEPPGELWDHVHVHALAAALDCRRRWLPSPNPLHDAKKSAARLEVESARAADVPVFMDLDGYSLEDLLLQLTTCDQRQLRECVYEAVRAKLDILGVVEE